MLGSEKSRNDMKGRKCYELDVAIRTCQLTYINSQDRCNKKREGDMLGQHHMAYKGKTSFYLTIRL